MKSKTILMFSTLAALSISTSALATSAPFAKGSFANTNWELRFNLPVCSHEGQKKDVWCDFGDANASATKIGTEDRLIEMINAPKTKSIWLAYFSFSNSKVQEALCTAAKTKSLPINIFIHTESYAAISQRFQGCGSSIRVYDRGKPFGSSEIQHIKVFLASETTDLNPMTSMSGAQQTDAAKTRVTFTSSSGNLSSFGTSLHFDNWMFLDMPTSDYVAQANVCMFAALRDSNNVRTEFTKMYESCRSSIQAKPTNELEFYVVPSSMSKSPRPYEAMKNLVLGANKSLHVAIHRLTTAKIYKDLFRTSAYRGVQFKLIMDDDALRKSKVNGGDAGDVGKDDIVAFRTLRSVIGQNGNAISFMETKADASSKQYHHNKFIIADGKEVFQGSGNFTSSSLNISGQGNYEQFYVIRDPGMVKGFIDGYKVLESLATPYLKHPVGNNPDMDLNDIPGEF